MYVRNLSNKIQFLLCRYPALRVAYIEEKEEIIGDEPKKVYSSILAKAVGTFDQVLGQSSCLNIIRLMFN